MSAEERMMEKIARAANDEGEEADLEDPPVDVTAHAEQLRDEWPAVLRHLDATLREGKQPEEPFRSVADPAMFTRRMLEIEEADEDVESYFPADRADMFALKLRDNVLAKAKMEEMVSLFPPPGSNAWLEKRKEDARKLEKTPFTNYAGGLESFFLHYAQEGDLVFSMSEQADWRGETEKVTLPRLPQGQFHWSDDRFVNGAIVVRVREEVRGTHNDPELAVGNGGDRVVKQAVVVDLHRRAMHVLEWSECDGIVLSEKDGWDAYEIPSPWVSAFKKVKWPEPWNQPNMKLRFPVNESMVEDVILSAYPLDFSVSAQKF